MTLGEKIILRWKSRSLKDLSLKKIFNKLDKLSSKKYSKQAEKIHSEVFQELDCLSCANCCKSIPPIVSKRDSKRISKALNISLPDFENQYLVIDNDGDRVINSSPCPFLETDNKCKIYEFRPSACRQYPHSGENAFFEHLSLHKRNTKYCPALYEIIKRLDKLTNL